MAISRRRPRPATVVRSGSVILLALVAATFGLPRGATTPLAGAATENRVLEIVQTGPEPDAPVKSSCIRFSEDSISGAEALRRASQTEGWDVQFASFGTTGQAICSICHVGCSSGDCFCDPKKYWAYDRAPAGSSTFRPSPVGASSTRLHDGDVEGWRWGEGQAPPYTSVVAACGGPDPVAQTSASPSTTAATAGAQQPPPDSGGPAPPPEPGATTTSPVLAGAGRPAAVDPSHLGSAPSGAATPTSLGPSSGKATLAPSSEPGSPSAPSAVSTSMPKASGNETAAGATHGGGGFDPAWLAYIALLAGLAALWIRARQAKRHRSPGA